MGKVRKVDDDAEVVTAKWAMAYLNISRQFFYKEVNAEHLRTIKRGLLRMTTKSAIADYIRLCESKSVDANGKPIMGAPGATKTEKKDK